MHKLLLTIALMPLCHGAYAQNTGSFNRYGFPLTESGGTVRVQGEDKMAARFNFNPDTIPGWTEPWVYLADKIQPADLEKCTVESLDYKKYGDYACHMDVYLPAGQGAGPFPFVMFIHGGGWTTGHKKTPNMTLPAAWFASHGIAAMSVSYTLSGQGTFEDTRADLNDALAYIRANAAGWRLDVTRFGFYGFSAGGHLAGYMAMTTPGTKMFISTAGPADMTLHGEEWAAARPELVRYFGYTPGDAEPLRRASPLFLIPRPADRIPAAMIIQGLMDMQVDPQQSIGFAAALRAEGAQSVELVTVPCAPHATVNPRFCGYEDLMARMLAFTKKYM